ncbi:unnamed protein product, partial [Ectocarpus sp. 8 AP-2014]
RLLPAAGRLLPRLGGARRGSNSANVQDHGAALSRRNHVVPAAVRQKHLNYARRLGNVVQRFHGTSSR